MKRLSVLICFLLIPVSAFANPPITIFSTATPTVDTSAYASGDLIGGKLTFNNALGDQSGTGAVNSIKIVDQAAQASDLDLVIFSSNPTNTTFTDQVALDIADADLSKVVAVITLGSSTRFSFADNSVHYIGSLYIPVQGATSNTVLYGALVSRGTPTFAASTDVSVTLGVTPDSN